MPGALVRVIPKQNFVFNGIATVVAAKGIDISGYREATLLFRIHSGTSIAAGTSLVVNVYIEAPTTDDPATDFVSTTSLATLTFTNTSTVPWLQVSSLGANNLGGTLRIIFSTTGASSTTAVVSADISVKS